MPSKAAQALFKEIEDEKRSKLLSEDVKDDMLLKAEKRVAEVVKRGRIFNTNAEEKVLKFLMEELDVDKKLGLGGYCIVNSIGAFHIPTMNKKPELHSREFMAMQCIRGEDGPRYAIKKLSDETKSNERRFMQGIADLVIEARLLSVIQHANIIKLRGVADGGYMNKDFFIIMDRLHITLDKQLLLWREATNKLFCVSCFSKNKQTAQDIYDDKLAASVGIASALEFLHSKNIIYRDLKPENIGFDVRDNIKLFDFGLAIECDPSKADKDGTYKLTGFTGSPLYMAPEVAKRLPYNTKADVHSFGILLWQIITTRSPFDKLTLDALEEFVFYGDHRPKIESNWSPSLSNLMRSCWDKNLAERPAFDSIIVSLQNEGLGVEDTSRHSVSGLDISTKSFNGIMKRLNGSIHSKDSSRDR